MTDLYKLISIHGINVQKSDSATFEEWKEKLTEMHSYGHLETKFIEDLGITETEAFTDPKHEFYIGCFYHGVKESYVYVNPVYRGLREV